MAQNPYQAPAAAVADPAVVAVPRPPAVTRACRTLWIVFGLGFITLLPPIRGTWWITPGTAKSQASVLAATLIMMVFFSVLFALFVWFVGKGRNWARWALLVFTAFGCLMQLSDFSRSIAVTPIAAILDVAMTAIELWACYVLFRGPAAAWFSGRPA